jgi:hypothetical protein
VNWTAYTAYLLILAAAAVLLLASADRLEAIGPWAAENPGGFLLAVAAVVLAAALLPVALLLAALGVLSRTAQRAAARLGAGDAAGAQALLLRLERWTPRLRWLMLNPAQVEVMKGFVCGMAPAVSASLAARGRGGPPAGASSGPRPGPFLLVRYDERGGRSEVARFATRDEAERQREEMEQVAEGHRITYAVEGDAGGTPAA